MLQPEHMMSVALDTEHRKTIRKGSIIMELQMTVWHKGALKGSHSVFEVSHMGTLIDGWSLRPIQLAGVDNLPPRLTTWYFPTFESLLERLEFIRYASKFAICDTTNDWVVERHA